MKVKKRPQASALPERGTAGSTGPEPSSLAVTNNPRLLCIAVASTTSSA